MQDVYILSAVRTPIGSLAAHRRVAAADPFQCALRGGSLAKDDRERRIYRA